MIPIFLLVGCCGSEWLLIGKYKTYREAERASHLLITYRREFNLEPLAMQIQEI